MCVRISLSLCVCVCVCVRARARVSVCVCVCACVFSLTIANSQPQIDNRAFTNCAAGGAAARARHHPVALAHSRLAHGLGLLSHLLAHGLGPRLPATALQNQAPVR